MQVNQSELSDLARKANELMSESEEVARLLRMRLGAGHEVVRSADDVRGSLQALVHELRAFCVSGNHDEIEVSKDI